MAQPNLTLSGSTPPTRLGRYLLGRELGRGFSSVVYEATDPLRGRQVALKVLTFLQNLSPARRQDLTERFEREARAISTLAHPSIVAIYEIGHAEDGRQFIAMEHLDGETLRARLQRAGPLPAAEALPIIAQVADALQYAHGRGIIHRDVKPDNVFVCPDGTAKLMDFGVAHVFADDGLTQTGTVVGSPAYMSPEQINGRQLDGRSDVFSLAATLAEALTGRKPFEAPNIPAVMNQILHRPPQLSGITSRPLRRVLERGLAKNPQARLPSPAAFAEALRRIEPSLPPVLGGSPQATMVMPRPRAPLPRPARPAGRGMLLPLTAALGLAALAALPFALHRHSAAPWITAQTPTPAGSTPDGHAYHITSEWHRASGAPPAGVTPPRTRHQTAVALAPPPHEGDGRAVEQVSAAPVTPDRQDILRLLRHQIEAVPLVPARRVSPPRPLFAPLPPRMSAGPARPIRAAFLPTPPARTAAPPIVRTADSRQERRPPAPVAAPSAPPPARSDAPIPYPYGTGPDPQDDAPAPREPDISDSAPRLVHRTQPLYPPEARARGAQGLVGLRVFINEDGNVDDATVIRSSGSEVLDESALAAVLHWEYEPAFQNGRAVPATIREQVTFSL